MERIEKINGEEFTVRKGKGDCLLEEATVMTSA